MDQPNMLHLKAAALHFNPMNYCSYLLPMFTISLLPLLIPYSARSLTSLAPTCDGSGTSAYALLLHALGVIPPLHYYITLFFLLVVYLYNALGFHLLHDIMRGFRGERVVITYNPASELCRSIISKCNTLRGRYLATPWLGSPHLQCLFLFFFPYAPTLSYTRELVRVSDGGTIALDWLAGTSSSTHKSNELSKNDEIPIVIVIPGLSSDFNSQYIRHIAFKISQRGWHTCICNHVGLGGVQVTSDRFYHGGWTKDVREIVKHVHNMYTHAPLYAVGTSVGANILVKYLGEDGDDVQILGAVAISCPWDFVLFDRFINRNTTQAFYNKLLTISLQAYAFMHQTTFSSHVDWEAIRKARTFREFDRNSTIQFGNFETVDAYYRQCGSASYVKNIATPLLCINALDDPICSAEAIPWDECMENGNIILATTCRGSHVAHFEGIIGNNMWWMRVIEEFIDVLHSYDITQKEKRENNVSFNEGCGMKING